MRLFIGMPLYGQMPWQTTVALNGLMREGAKDCEITFKLLQGESNIVEARNTLTMLFLQSECDRMLFLDSDMAFKPHQVARVCCHDEGVVGGLYTKKQHGPRDFTCMGLAGQERGVADEHGLIEVEKIATGFLCIQRYVFELMEKKLSPPRYWTARGEQADFWSIEPHVGADGRRWYQGEDYSWCSRWRRIGGRIFADARVLVGHVGSVVWPVDWEAGV